MDLLQYSSSDSESAEEMDKPEDIRAESSTKSPETPEKAEKVSSAKTIRKGSTDLGRKSKDGTNYETADMELSEDSDEKSTARKHKRHSPERRSREREPSHKKSRSHRDRSEERGRSSYDGGRRRRNDEGHSRHHNSRDDYNDRRYRSDKYRNSDVSYRRDDRRRGDKYRDDRSNKNRGNSDRNSGGYSESDKYKRSNRDDRRRHRRSRSGSEEKRDARYRSHSKSKEKEVTEVISSNKRQVPPVVPSVTTTNNTIISTTVSLTKKEKSKSPEISAVLAPPINTVNPVAAERKLAKLDQLGITLHANSLNATSSMPGIKLPEGVAIPAYYNPNAINVTKYAEQIQKRKLLWSSKKAEPAAATSTWNKATFSQDTDGKVASKFMRLMGIKDATAVTPPESAENDLDKQKKLFSTMEQQYEVARQVTHTMRGVGLGFGSQPRQF